MLEMSSNCEKPHVKKLYLMEAGPFNEVHVMSMRPLRCV